MFAPGSLPRRVAKKVLRREQPQVAIEGVRDATPVQHVVDGFVLNLPKHFAQFYVDKPFEVLSGAFIHENVRAGDTVVDVGAHIGMVTLVLARLVGPEGKVHSVEPAAENLDYLKRNLEDNGLTQVELHSFAASDHDFEATFHITGSSDSHGLYDHPNTRTVATVKVPAKRLDSVVSRLDFFKIDTEGAELDVLRGMEHVFEGGRRPAGLVEWTPACQERAGYGARELIDHLIGLGYHLTVLDDANGESGTPDDYVARLAAGELSDSWYANLACRPAGAR